MAEDTTARLACSLLRSDLDDGRSHGTSRLTYERRLVSTLETVNPPAVIRHEEDSADPAWDRCGGLREQSLALVPAVFAGQEMIMRSTSLLVVGRFVGRTYRRRRVIDTVPIEADEPAAVDPDCGESVGEGEVVNDQRRFALEATIAEGHAAALLVLARMDRRRRRHGADDTAPGCEATSAVERLVHSWLVRRQVHKPSEHRCP